MSEQIEDISKEPEKLEEKESNKNENEEEVEVSEVTKMDKAQENSGDDDKNQGDSEKAVKAPDTSANDVEITKDISEKTDVVVKEFPSEKKEKVVKPREKCPPCYCGKLRNLNIIELNCANCNGWFHESCISYQLGKLVAFTTNYIFLCKNCSPSALEMFKKNQATTNQLCLTAIANLMQASAKAGNPKLFFSKEKEILPYIESHWDGMNTNTRRPTQSWQTQVVRALVKEINVTLVTNEENMFGLLVPDITLIKPNYEAMIKMGALKMTDTGVQPVGSLAMKGRGGTKRRSGGDILTGLKRNRPDLGSTKMSPHGYPLEHPFNKDSYRYFLAEPDPHAPFRQEFDESVESAGKRIPGWLYRTMCPSAVLIALHDRAPQLRVSEDRQSIAGEKGYCMARATHFVSRDTWYYEVIIEDMPEGSACRLGWGQAFANLQTPLGFDKFGYSWRSLYGTKFHEGRGKHYSDDGYGEGDVLGFLIHLPHTKHIPHVEASLKDRPLVKFKSHLYYEEKDNVPEILKKLKPLEGSKIVCFKNGESRGVAFADIYAGSYYPAVSLYKNCTITVNFGPEFKFPPKKEEYSYKPICERAIEMVSEQTLADMLYLAEWRGKLKLEL